MKMNTSTLGREQSKDKDKGNELNFSVLLVK